MWLAFKLFIFTEKSHRITSTVIIESCCDWLSNCLFLQRSHTSDAEPKPWGVLWLAFKLFIFTEKSHTYLIVSPLDQVVIGFQIVYFYREVTHATSGQIAGLTLWLAFKLFIFTEKSHKRKIYVDYNLVVIGFQIVYFYREVTQPLKYKMYVMRLWLAFKLFIFTEKSHIISATEAYLTGCDWLSNCLFLQRSHTSLSFKPSMSKVVIGFQIVYFYREVTHNKGFTHRVEGLWLAFKLFIFTEKSHTHLFC